MLYHRRLINHFREIKTWLAAQGGEAHLDMNTFRIALSANGRQHVLYPQFLLETGEALAYTPNLTADVNGFIGWVPYPMKRWPAAVNKLLFKQHVEQHGKRTPQYWLDTRDPIHGAIVKPAVGSFGVGLRGPYATIDPDNPAHRLRPGEYYERFRQGAILKVWYWNERPICVEMRDPLFVVGDGARSIWSLTLDTYQPAGRGLRLLQERRQALEALLSYQGWQWDSVPPVDAHVQVDFLYGSPLHPEQDGNANRLQAIQGSPLEREITESGPIFWHAIPEDIRVNTFYAIDGIAAEDGTVRWLEMNCNPMFPPDAYGIVLDSICNG